MRFIKFQGYGNDYIVVERRHLSNVDSVNDFARRVCDRHYGAGADGVAMIAEAEDTSADFGVRIFNPDGGEAAMSGNGTRCAAAYLHYEGIWSREHLRLSTRAGVKLYNLREQSNGGFKFKAELGRPEFDSAAIPMIGDQPLPTPVTNYPLQVDNETIQVTALLMCNPNCCVFVDDFSSVDWQQIGRSIETHQQFPARTNVEFISVRDPHNIDVHVWERGVGPTLSSGTGACAAAVAAHINGRATRNVLVSMPGGRLEVEWRDDGEVLLTGTAEVVYRGEWLEKR